MLAYSPDEDTSSRRHFITGTAQHVYYLTITAAVAFPVGASLRRHGHDPAVNLITTGTCASQPRVSLPPAQAQGQLDVAKRLIFIRSVKHNHTFLGTVLAQLCG